MNFQLFADMGRMNGRCRSGGKIGCSPDRNAAVDLLPSPIL